MAIHRRQEFQLAFRGSIMRMDVNRVREIVSRRNRVAQGDRAKQIVHVGGSGLLRFTHPEIERRITSSRIFTLFFQRTRGHQMLSRKAKTLKPKSIPIRVRGASGGFKGGLVGTRCGNASATANFGRTGWSKALPSTHKQIAKLSGDAPGTPARPHAHSGSPAIRYRTRDKYEGKQIGETRQRSGHTPTRRDHERRQIGRHTRDPGTTPRHTLLTKLRTPTVNCLGNK